ncbi:stage V sporulation protein AA [Mediterraneibacter agrestimuris]|uniref:stage V sporulation protein AA n=1 Tax=Mediterraneibacter agrestimuris TaxID=2941333 RepID=UPI00203B74B6|nr:stage V sporulation protein AA [Mediterraneibacter agrestimuris]
MPSSQDTLYIKGERDVEITKTDVTLGDILTFECSNKTVIPKVKTMKILKIPDNGKKEQRFVISILKIIACIHEQYPNLDIQNLGETDIIITYENQKTPGKLFHILKTAFVVVLTFCGAAFSIMAFNNDISVTKLFSQIYEAMTGAKSSGFTILEISYSVGIAVGILMFFNHFGKKRFTVDPTPLEVQMRLYENDIQTTLVEDASRRKEELDVGKSNTIGTYRS